MVRTLIIEDSATQAQELLMTLEAEGLSAAVCSTLASGREQLHEGGFDVVLLDLFLPDASGTEGLERLQDEFRDVPMVVLTSHDDEPTAIRSLQLGAQDYIVKGELSPALLVRLIGRAVERHRIARTLERLQRELVVKNVALTMLNEEKNQFLGMAAHDLRNPLSVILAFSSFLLESTNMNLRPQQIEFVQAIHRSSEFMLRLVHDFLDISTIESGKLKLNLERVDLGAILDDVVHLNRPIALKKGIELLVHRPETLPRISGDPYKLEQVLTNLVTNAIKFSHSGTRVTLGGVAENGQVRISVKDQGQGIPKDELGNLFKAFSATSVKATAAERSTGLGLLIVRKVIEGHGGTIRVESEVGRGTTFFVTLPAQGG